MAPKPRTHLPVSLQCLLCIPCGQYPPCEEGTGQLDLGGGGRGAEGGGRREGEGWRGRGGKRGEGGVGKWGYEVG